MPTVGTLQTCSIASAPLNSQTLAPVASTVFNSNNIGTAVSSAASIQCAVPSSSSITTTSTGASVVVGEKPLVQPHLLQQQQQQILQMIQSQQPPQQRLASHVPIKVPQYTASPIRTIASSTSGQVSYEVLKNLSIDQLW